MRDPEAERVWRERRERLFDFAARHTFTARQLAWFFAGRTLATRLKKVSRFLVRQVRRKKIRVRGVVQTTNGRPPTAYGRKCKPDEVDHEVMVAELELLLGNRIERGVTVGRAEPDGVLARGGNTCYAEVDHSGKMTVRKQMVGKWHRYVEAKPDGYLLVVAMTEARMQKLREWIESSEARNLALFTTFDRLRNGKPWVDWTGTTVDI